MARAPKKHPIFVTERLRLRPFRNSDLKVMHTLYADADNLRFWGVGPSPNLTVTRRMLGWHLAFRPRHYVMWAVEQTKSRKVVGMINYHRRDLRERRVDVGWLLLPEFQGKVHKVEAVIRPENKPSTALAKRWGFRLEGGPIRDRWFVSGPWHSVMIYGLIAGEER